MRTNKEKSETSSLAAVAETMLTHKTQCEEQVAIFNAEKTERDAKKALDAVDKANKKIRSTKKKVRKAKKAEKKAKKAESIGSGKPEDE